MLVWKVASFLEVTSDQGEYPGASRGALWCFHVRRALTARSAPFAFSAHSPQVQFDPGRGSVKKCDPWEGGSDRRRAGGRHGLLAVLQWFASNYRLPEEGLRARQALCPLAHSVAK